MKIEVIKAYIDKLTDEMRSIGQKIEVEEERAKELIGKGFAVAVKDAEKPPKKAEKKPTKKTSKKK